VFAGVGGERVAVAHWVGGIGVGEGEDGGLVVRAGEIGLAEGDGGFRIYDLGFRI
jgi:hypothetical protein